MFLKQETKRTCRNPDQQSAISPASSLGQTVHCTLSDGKTVTEKYYLLSASTRQMFEWPFEVRGSTDIHGSTAPKLRCSDSGPQY